MTRPTVNAALGRQVAPPGGATGLSSADPSTASSPRSDATELPTSCQATLVHGQLNPDIFSRSIDHRGLLGSGKLRMEGMPIFAIAPDGGYRPFFKTRPLAPGEVNAPIEDQESYAGRNCHARCPLNEPLMPDGQLPSIGGDRVVEIHYFVREATRPVVLGHVRADAMRVLHMETLSQVSRVLGGLHRELHPSQGGSRLPAYLRAIVQQVVAIDVPALSPVDLGAPTAVLAGEAVRRMGIYRQLYDKIDQTPGAMAVLAGVMVKYMHSTVLAHPDHAVEYYGSATWRYLMALVLRQDSHACQVAEDFLGTNDTGYSMAFETPPTSVLWASQPLAAKPAATFRPLSRGAQNIYLEGGAFDFKAHTLTAGAKTCVAELLYCTDRLDCHPAAIAMAAHLRVMTVPVVEHLPAERSAVGSLIDPAGLALPQDIAQRATRLKELIAGSKALRPLRARLSTLARQAEALSAEVFCDGHMALQAAALLQRPNTLGALSSSLLDLEQSARQGLASLLSSPTLDDKARAVAPKPRRPAPSSPVRRPAWWTDDVPTLGTRPAAAAPLCPDVLPRQEPLQRLTFAPGVFLPSRMSKRQLGELLLSTFDPGTFSYGHAHPVTASAASAQYHLRKHGAPQAAVEDYIFEARAAFRRDFVGEVSARAGAFGERIKLLQNERYYGCFAWDERILTFCSRDRCQDRHYPGRGSPEGIVAGAEI